MLFIVVLVVLAVIGLGTLLGGATTAGAAGLGVLAIVVGLMFKVVLFMLLFGLVARMFWSGGRAPRHHRRPRHRSGRKPEPEPSAEDRFEEWHRMAHAREEVDSWVDGLPGDTA